MSSWAYRATPMMRQYLETKAPWGGGINPPSPGAPAPYPPKRTCGGPDPSSSRARDTRGPRGAQPNAAGVRGTGEGRAGGPGAPRGAGPASLVLDR